MKSIHGPRYIELINHLKRVRRAKKINQSTVAEFLNIDRTQVTKIETLVRRLDFIELCDWLDALDCNLEEFLKGIGRL